MNIRRYALAVLLILSLACSTVTRVFTGPPPSPSPDGPTPSAAVSDVGLPVYVPPECENVPPATVPPSTAVPTPYLAGNVEVPPDMQLRVFDDVVAMIEDVYVYEDFNGLDWEGIVSTHRANIEAGLATPEFYAEMQALIVDLGDEHSWFESPIEVEAADAELAGSNDFVGIGVYFLPLFEKERITILSIFPDSPAEHSGLQPHDSILAVDGQPIVQDGETYDFRVRGPECSAVMLTVQSPGHAPRDMMLIRRRIQSPSVILSSLVPTTDSSRIGYIFLPSFNDETLPGQVAEALEGFGALDGLIIDNRMNGGGSSSVVEPILSFFASGVLGEYTSRNNAHPLEVDPDPIHNSQMVPIVVLVSEETVSYGEVFSGVLRDAGRARIVGQATLGNVEILHGYYFDDGSRLWIAEETFTPVNSQANWEQTGIIPDVEAHADWDTFTFENDPGVAAAVTLLGH